MSFLVFIKYNHLDAMMQHKGWRAVGWGVVRHDFSEPLLPYFFFTLYATLHRRRGLNWPKDWGALTFGIRTMKVWLRLSSNDAVVKAFCTIDTQSPYTISQHFWYKIGLKPSGQGAGFKGSHGEDRLFDLKSGGNCCEEVRAYR